MTEIFASNWTRDADAPMGCGSAMANAAESARAESAETIARLEREVRRLKVALRGVLREYDRNTCQHENTHRGGAIWTICDDCGMKWADDRGGFQPYVDPPAVAAARALTPGGDDGLR